MTRTTDKIHCHFTQYHVNGSDVAEAPAFVRAKPFGGHLQERLHIIRVNFPGSR